jgi:hypothetical protein
VAFSGTGFGIVIDHPLSGWPEVAPWKGAFM